MLMAPPHCEASSCDQLIAAGNRARCTDCLTEALDCFEQALACSLQSCSSDFVSDPDRTLSLLMLSYQKLIVVLMELECSEEARAQMTQALATLDKLHADARDNAQWQALIAHHRALFQRKWEHGFGTGQTTTDAPEGAPVMSLNLSY